MGPQSGSKKQNKAAKNAKMAAARQRVAEQRERDRKSARRRSAILGSAAVIVAGGVIAGLAVVVMTSDGGGGDKTGTITAEVAPAPNIASPIQGVVAYSASRTHEPNKNIIYKEQPPVGGQHDPNWQTCGIYNESIADRNGVHSMEHGAVWITYSPTLPADQVAKLKAKAKQDYMLLSPHDDMSTPITVTAWGFQLKVDNADDPRIDDFIKLYRVNQQTTPEPGASCSGGVGKPVKS
ncbi:DUF3105 domain-containing protein [Yinghuangia seranimata]|uniref:DUF3105 domain-containing protein n=1 Tax=Yinghuangia seranimata TaxID=408067 RepID=UPI00248C2FDF|nr:DUF3105 domain-containing protein [Yinghuangia seranimata]MDI2132690.1 DUF3105 domain-containing protein [Yinghuangia seranimata]